MNADQTSLFGESLATNETERAEPVQAEAESRTAGQTKPGCSHCGKPTNITLTYWPMEEDTRTTVPFCGEEWCRKAITTRLA